MLDIFYNEIFVRHGFGFYNPNHAAAFICMLLPMFCGWKKWQKLGLCIKGLLCVALVMTFSRAGLIMFVLELLCYVAVCHHHDYRKLSYIAGGLIVVAMILSCAIMGRLALDNSILNRLQIWHAGIQLAIANPLGVGWGNSGRIASYFMLEGIDCRTLINAPLTLLAEGGWVIGLLWCLFVIIACCSFRNDMVRYWCAFVAMTLSSFASTTFDFGLLFDCHYIKILGFSNYFLSWLSLVIYLVLGLMLCVRNFDKRHIIAALCILCVLLLSCVFLRMYDNKDDVPHIDGDVLLLSVPTSCKCIAIYDDDTVIHDIKAYLSVTNWKFAIALHPGIPCKVDKYSEVLLFGNAAEYSHLLNNSKITIVSLQSGE